MAWGSRVAPLARLGLVQLAVKSSQLAQGPWDLTVTPLKLSDGIGLDGMGPPAQIGLARPDSSSAFDATRPTLGDTHNWLLGMLGMLTGVALRGVAWSAQASPKYRS